MTPAEITCAVHHPSNSGPPPCPPDQMSIHIHHLPKINNWVTSMYKPTSRRILIYDILGLPTTFKEVMPQLQTVDKFNDPNKIDYIPVSQQGSDPSCGAYAIEFAFSYGMGTPPETQNFMESYTREHWRQCLSKSQDQPFSSISKR